MNPLVVPPIKQQIKLRNKANHTDQDCRPLVNQLLDKYSRLVRCASVHYGKAESICTLQSE